MTEDIWGGQFKIPLISQTSEEQLMYTIHSNSRLHHQHSTDDLINLPMGGSLLTNSHISLKDHVNQMNGDPNGTDQNGNIRNQSQDIDMINKLDDSYLNSHMDNSNNIGGNNNHNQVDSTLNNHNMNSNHLNMTMGMDIHNMANTMNCSNSNSSSPENEYQDFLNSSLVTPPPLPPPLPTHLHIHPSYAPAVSTQQIIQQSKRLRPVAERGQEDKKKEALAFLNFYFKIVPTNKTPTVSRSSILALYTNKTPVDKRYKQPNDMANLCGAVYTFIFQHLTDDKVAEFISSAENERLSSRTDLKKRKRKKNHDVTESHQDINYHDAFLTCIKYASLLPFIEFINIHELNTTKRTDPYTLTHLDWSYTSEDLQKWEFDLKDQKTSQKTRSFSPTLPSFNEDSSMENNNNNSNSTTNFASNSYSNHVYSNLPTTSTTTSLFINNQNNCNFSQNANSSPNSANNTTNNINFFNTFGSNGLTSANLINIPVNVTETADNFIIYAFIPFYKPNALTIKVNQMDIILEGSISLPDTIQIPNGSEIPVPNILNSSLCSQCDIQEGNFCKIIKLTHPIASSTVGKRDGVVVIIAKKEEGQTTIHQL